MTPTKKTNIISELQRDILRLQGFNTTNNPTRDIGLGPIMTAFPNGSFPIGALHEFISEATEQATATLGFISGILCSLMGSSGTILWISASRTLFPPALKNFGIQPDRFIFIDLQKEKDVHWAMEEALKCNGLSAVVAEIRALDFTTSRRLQLAVEQSEVTGFIVRNNVHKLTTTACVSRWKITPLQSEPMDDLPGIGFPSWRVELIRMRNGKTGVWDMQWIAGRLVEQTKIPAHLIESQKKFG
jgi:protein ImuA